MSGLEGVAVVVVGLVAGFLNTVAGGGSLLTLPLLMLFGLPASVANGTNRVGIVAQSLTGVGGFRRADRLDYVKVPSIVAPTVLGALAGSGLAVYLPATVLEPVLLVVLVLMAVLLAVRPGVLMGSADAEPLTVRQQPGAAIALFAAGFYGGFAQAGVGFLLLAAVGGVLRYDIVRANAMKVMCNLVFGVAALAVFAAAGDVDWRTGALLALGMSAGAFAGVRFAVRAPASAVRWVVVVCVAVAVAAVWRRSEG